MSEVNKLFTNGGSGDDGEERSEVDTGSIVYFYDKSKSELKEYTYKQDGGGEITKGFRNPDTIMEMFDANQGVLDGIIPDYTPEFTKELEDEGND